RRGLAPASENDQAKNPGRMGRWSLHTNYKPCGAFIAPCRSFRSSPAACRRSGTSARLGLQNSKNLFRVSETVSLSRRYDIGSFHSLENDHAKDDLSKSAGCRSHRCDSLL